MALPITQRRFFIPIPHSTDFIDFDNNKKLCRCDASGKAKLYYKGFESDRSIIVFCRLYRQEGEYYIVAGITKGKILRWQVETGQLVGQPLLANSLLTYARIYTAEVKQGNDLLSSVTKLLTIDINNNLQRWNLVEGSPIDARPFHIGQLVKKPLVPYRTVYWYVYTIEGENYLTIFCEDNRLVKFNLETNQLSTICQMNFPGKYITSLITYAVKDKTYLALTNIWGCVERIDLKTGEKIKPYLITPYLDLYGIRYGAAYYSGRDLYILVVDEAGRILCWDAVTGVRKEKIFLSKLVTSCMEDPITEKVYLILLKPNGDSQRWDVKTEKEVK